MSHSARALRWLSVPSITLLRWCLSTQRWLFMWPWWRETKSSRKNVGKLHKATLAPGTFQSRCVFRFSAYFFFPRTRTIYLSPLCLCSDPNDGEKVFLFIHFSFSFPHSINLPLLGAVFSVFSSGSSHDYFSLGCHPGKCASTLFVRGIALWSGMRFFGIINILKLLLGVGRLARARLGKAVWYRWSSIRAEKERKWLLLIQLGLMVRVLAEDNFEWLNIDDFVNFQMNQVTKRSTKNPKVFFALK